MSSVQHPVRYLFGEIVLDPAARELRRAGRLLTPSPKVFDCLAYLIEHRERAVGRDELIAAVWGRVDVADVQLGQLIRKVRTAIGDSGDEQGAIRTVPRFGYRWVADVEIDENASSLTRPPSNSVPASTSQSARDKPARTLPLHERRRAVVVLSAVLAALCVGTGYWKYVRMQQLPSGLAEGGGTPLAPQTANLNAVAVLPVDIGADPDPDRAWMRLGLMDLIASHLRSAHLTVVPSDNIIALARESKTTDAVADTVRIATGARYLALPSAVHTDQGWKVRLELSSSDGTRHDVEARAADAMSAAREATDRLLDALGKSAPSDPTKPGELQQRVEAALLIGDFDAARRLIGGAPPELRNSTELRLDLARIDRGKGDFQAARKGFASLLAETPPETDPTMRARILGGLAAATFRMGEVDAAQEEFTEAVTLLENGNEPALLGKAYMDRATAEILRGRYDDAATDFSRARVILEPAGDALALARLNVDEGALEGLRNHYTEALPLFARAERAFERFGAQGKLIQTLGNEIDAHLQLLQPADALAIHDRAQAQFSRDVLIKSPAFRFQRARALMENGRLSHARSLLSEIMAPSDSKQDIAQLAMAQGLEAKLDLESGDAVTAVALARQAIGHLSEPEYANVRASTWLTGIQALRDVHQNDDAAAETRNFAAWAATSGNESASIHAHLAEAEQAWSERRRDAAHKLYRDALAEANQEGVPADIAEVAVSFGNALVSEGDMDRASAVIGQITRWTDRNFDCALLQARLYHELNQPEAWRKAMVQVRSLAGERVIPPVIAREPTAALVSGTGSSVRH